MEFENAKEYKNKVRKLYRSAFPANERAPFWMMLSKTKDSDNNFYAVTDNSDFIGLVYTIKSNKAVYVFFLAVDETQRGKGYGTKILEMIKNRHPDLPVMLMIEDTDITDADNYKERLNRLEFYKKNGFKQLHIKIIEAGVNYELLGTEDTVTLDNFFEIMKGFLGGFLFKIIYRKMKP